MNVTKSALLSLLVVSLLCSLMAAQQPASSSQQHAVPRLVNFSGRAVEVSGKTISGVAGVTFAIYKDQYDGSPLWLETQNVQADARGNYSAQLGATRAEGLPLDLFSSGEARWLGVRVNGGQEQPRVLLLSVPYALKAADAETIGGLPPSAFMLAAPVSSGASSNRAEPSSPTSSSGAPPVTSNVTTTGGTINVIPLFTTATNIQNSILTQTAATAVNVGGKLNLPATGAATAVAGKNSHPLDFVGSSFSSSTSAAVNQTFQWQAEPAANNTANPSGTLNLLYGLGTTAPGETGLKLSNKGVFTFAAGQTFPGTGSGTVKSVGLTAPASDFTVSGSPVTGTGSLNFVWTVAPTSANTANAIVKRDASGNFAGNTITAGTFDGGQLNVTNASISNSLFMLTSAVNPLSVASGLGNATSIGGNATATTGAAWGVEGVTDSDSYDAYGVVGFAASSTGNPKGVYGQASSTKGFGVVGQNGSPSSTGSGLSTYITSAGVWGDGGSAGSINTLVDIAGVVGTTDDSVAGYFSNNSTGYYSLSVIGLNPAGFPFQASNLSGAGCNIDSAGNLNCSGSKNAVVPIDGGKRKVAMSAIEAPQNWFEDAGSAPLVNGAAVVTLDRDYAQTVNTEKEYQVFLTPYGDCKGLYVANRTANSFEVHELGGGTASLNFGYRIMALRKKYEIVRFADHTNDPDPRKMIEGMKNRAAQPASPSGKNPMPSSPLHAAKLAPDKK
jgi:hypothetical protein